jgi:tRNA(fMet)-specific endonuclease VapC
MILIDTDHLSVITDRRHAQHERLKRRLDAVEEPLAISVVSVEEQLRGWLAQIHRLRGVHRQIVPYGHLVRLLEFLCQWQIAAWDEAAANEFDSLRKSRIGSVRRISRSPAWR